jgi:hypothetical protein
MNRHLEDRTLLETLEGEGSPEEQKHLRSCAACAATRARLARDLEVLRSVLRDGPLPRPVARATGVRRWIPLAAAATVAAALAWGVSSRTPEPERLASSGPLSLRQVSAAVFATGDVEQLAKPVRGGIEVAAVQAALRGEWPCAQGDPWLDQDCD